MTDNLTGRRVLVPGGTGAVGEGIVRAYLAAGADVVVPTRTQQRADDFGQLIKSDRLHLFVHDYTTFAGAESLAEQMVLRLGGLDDVVAPIGGWWAGKPLWEVSEADWQDAFVGLATAHLAVLRAALPRLGARGAYTVIVGGSAFFPVPGSGLVSMEQAAVQMMQQVAAAEAGAGKRVFSLVLGPVATRLTGPGDPEQVTADQIGAVAVAASRAAGLTGRVIQLGNRSEAEAALKVLEV